MKSLFKKITAIVTLSALTISFCACGKDTANKSGASKTSEKTATETAAQNGYESKKFNLKFTPPEGYVMFTDSQKAAQMTGSKNTVCEMISEHNDGFPQVKVIFEKFNGDEAAYTEYMKEAFESSGINAVYGEPLTTEIAGKEFYSFSICAEESVNMDVYSRKYDDGILCISVTSLVGGAGGADVISAFSEMGAQ